MKEAKQFIKIDSVKGTNFLNKGEAFFYSDSGDIAFFVETNSSDLYKGDGSKDSYVLFKNETALCYPGKFFMSGLTVAKEDGTWTTVGINAFGDVFYHLYFENGQ